MVEIEGCFGWLRAENTGAIKAEVFSEQLTGAPVSGQCPGDTGMPQQKQRPQRN